MCVCVCVRIDKYMTFKQFEVYASVEESHIENSKRIFQKKDAFVKHS